jgi:hypothetical protein
VKHFFILYRAFRHVISNITATKVTYENLPQRNVFFSIPQNISKKNLKEICAGFISCATFDFD